MSKELEQKRTDASDDPTSYLATLDSIEPNIHPIDASTFYASAAISLKRIADAMELFTISLIKDHKEKERDMQSWAERHGFGDLWNKAND
jgi:hypothetical protein